MRVGVWDFSLHVEMNDGFIEMAVVARIRYTGSTMRCGRVYRKAELLGYEHGR